MVNDDIIKYIMFQIKSNENLKQLNKEKDNLLKEV